MDCLLINNHNLINDCLMCSCLLPYGQLVNRDNKLVLYIARPDGPENLPGKWRGRMFYGVVAVQCPP